MVTTSFSKIENQIKSKFADLKNIRLPKIIAVSKTFQIKDIEPLLEYGHTDFGENKVQEAIDKWTDIKQNNPNILNLASLELDLRVIDHKHMKNSYFCLYSGAPPGFLPSVSWTLRPQEGCFAPHGFQIIRGKIPAASTRTCSTFIIPFDHI